MSKLNECVVHGKVKWRNGIAGNRLIHASIDTTDIKQLIVIIQCLGEPGIPGIPGTPGIVGKPGQPGIDGLHGTKVIFIHLSLCHQNGKSHQ